MYRVNRIAGLALAGALCGCAPNPIVARDPVPAPTPDVGYACDSRPLVLNAFTTRCEPVLTQSQTVLRSKG